MSIAVDVSSELRRVSIHAGSVGVDLALPGQVPIAVLLPAVVDMLALHCGNGPDWLSSSIATTVQLSRPGAAPLDSSMTLAEQSIRDGAVLLLLTPAKTAVPGPRFDVFDAVIAAASTASRPWTAQAARFARVAVGCALATLGAVLLLRPAIGTSGPHHFGIAAVIAATALFSAVIAHRVYRDAVTGLSLAVLATGFAAVAGFLAVPGGPGSPNFLLSAMASLVASVIAMRVTGCGTVTFTSLSCFCLLVGGAALGSALWAVPARLIGAVLASVSIALLAVAARLSIAMARLSPGVPSAASAAPDDESPPGALSAKAVYAHERLTGLVAGFSSSAALGAAVTVVGVHTGGGSRSGGAAFVATVAAVLLLRARSLPDLVPSLALVISGTLSVSALFVAAATEAPQHAQSVCAVTAGLGVAALCLGFIAPAATFSPVAHRAVELFEYLALAAVVPLACWVCGLYAAVRGLSLA